MKTWRVCCLGLLLLIACVATAQIPCGPTITPLATLFVNWPQFRFNPEHTGCNPYETILSTATVGGLVLDWTYPAGSQVYGDPVVANGVVYFTSSYPDNTLYALNAVTGALVWKDATGIASLSSPIVVNGVVYVGVDTMPGGAVYAFNASTGEMLWQYATSNIVESAPAVANGVVYVGDGGGTLYALNAGTGAFAWSYRIPEYDIVASPAVYNGVVYFAASYPLFPQKGTLYALDVNTHQVVWQYMWPYAVGQTPVVGNGAVYFNSEAFNANTGAMLWESSVSFFSIPALANGVLYVGSDDQNVYAVNASTGKVLWGHRTGDFVSSSPAVANGVVYVESDDGNFYALDTATGAPRWQYTVSYYTASGPAVANGRVYIGSQNNNLYAFHLPGH